MKQDQIKCSHCGTTHSRNHRYCAKCQAAYMREWRKTHPMNEGQRKRDNARSHAGVYKKLGQIKQKPCERCGDRDSQMHHPDHELPRLVTWLCRPCHLGWHAHWRVTSLAVFKNWLRIRQKEAA